MTERAKQPPPNEPPPRRKRAAAIGAEAAQLARAGFERAGFSEPGLVLRWKEIVGAEVARLARPVRLTQSASGGVLTLKADPAASVFLQHETRLLCGRINDYLGRDAVRRLRFVPAEIAPEPKRPRRRPVPADAAEEDPARRFAGKDSLRRRSPRPRPRAPAISLPEFFLPPPEFSSPALIFPRPRSESGAGRKHSSDCLPCQTSRIAARGRKHSSGWPALTEPGLTRSAVATPGEETFCQLHRLACSAKSGAGTCLEEALRCRAKPFSPRW